MARGEGPRSLGLWKWRPRAGHRHGWQDRRHWLSSRRTAWLCLSTGDSVDPHPARAAVLGATERTITTKRPAASGGVGRCVGTPGHVVQAAVGRHEQAVRSTDSAVDRAIEFAGPALLTADYHLGPGSTAVDQGVDLFWVTTDIDGEPRPFGLGPDLGADEVPVYYLPLVLRSSL